MKKEKTWKKEWDHIRKMIMPEPVNSYFIWSHYHFNQLQQNDTRN